MKKLIETQLFEMEWAAEKAQTAELELQKRQEELHQWKQELKKTLEDYANKLYNESPDNCPFKEGNFIYSIGCHKIEIEFSEGQIVKLETIKSIEVPLTIDDKPKAEQL